jgi:hypothetical protein
VKQMDAAVSLARSQVIDYLDAWVSSHATKGNSVVQTIKNELKLIVEDADAFLVSLSEYVKRIQEEDVEDAIELQRLGELTKSALTSAESNAGEMKIEMKAFESRLIKRKKLCIDNYLMKSFKFEGSRKHKPLDKTQFR